ncbi:MAG: hypothetical protein IJL00_04925 [Clostridia bacterium]|nr:hypothetical protein [Clostridia bacterium]
MVNNSSYSAAIRSLWCDRCTVTIKRNTVNPKGRTIQSDETLFAHVPCRLSFKNISVPDDTSQAAKTVQVTVLILDRERRVPAGSKITVTHEGVTREYDRAGIPAVYSAHQEIPLVLRKEWV